MKDSCFIYTFLYHTINVLSYIKNYLNYLYYKKLKKRNRNKNKRIELKLLTIYRIIN